MCVQKEISKHFEGIEDHVKWRLNTIFINTARNDTKGRKEGRKEGKERRERGKTALAHPAPAMELSGAIFQF